MRPLLWALAIGAFLAIGVGLFTTTGTAFFLGALVVLLWSLLMIATAQSFAHPAPAVDPAAGMLARLKARCWRGYLRVLAIVTTVLFAFVVYVSIRAVALIARGTVG